MGNNIGIITQSADGTLKALRIEDISNNSNDIIVKLVPLDNNYDRYLRVKLVTP